VEKKNFVIEKLLPPVPSQSMVEQAKKHGGFRPQRDDPGKSHKTQSEVAEDRLMKDIIK